MSVSRPALGLSSLTCFLVFAVCLFFFLTACGRGKEVELPAPSSSITKAEALRLADAWLAGDPFNRGRSLVAPTGSMLPVLASNHVLLLERATGHDLQIGDIAIIEREPGKTFVHRVTDKGESSGGVFTRGDNNKAPDGWFFSNRVRWRVAGVIYFRKNAN